MFAIVLNISRPENCANCGRRHPLLVEGRLTSLNMNWWVTPILGVHQPQSDLGLSRTSCSTSLQVDRVSAKTIKERSNAHPASLSLPHFPK